ncbi:smr protein/Muts2-like [Allostella sp. ATCC 35155]|nr:smr protein/Muts2-like [Stella sp. ATCC 35155]
MVRDRDLWRRAVADVDPLPRRGERAPPARAAVTLPAVEASAPALPRPEARPQPSPRSSLLGSGAAIDVDARTVERLKRGRIAIDGRLDLHGLTQAEAYAALLGSVRAGVAQGRRCLLVITGRGDWGGTERGVLRRMVPRWLNEPAVRPHVLAFTEAQPRDGGAGALYLLLRRRR